MYILFLRGTWSTCKYILIYGLSEMTGSYKESELIKLDILINGDPVEPLSTIVHKDKV